MVITLGGQTPSSPNFLCRFLNSYISETTRDRTMIFVATGTAHWGQAEKLFILLATPSRAAPDLLEKHSNFKWPYLENENRESTQTPIQTL